MIMDFEMWLAVGIICVTCAVLVLVADHAERRWRRKHPPDFWDGCREDDERDDADD